MIGQKLGSAASSVIVHLAGAFFSMLVLFLNRGENIARWRELPWWTYGVGVLGITLFLTINYTIPRIGTTAAVALIIVGQLLAGMVIDHFGLLGVAVNPITWVRVAGMLLLFSGAYLIIR